MEVDPSGVHMPTDGITSWLPCWGSSGIWFGFPLADPIVGLVISLASFVLLWGTARDIRRRVLDGVAPALSNRQRTRSARYCASPTGSCDWVWTGHRLKRGRHRQKRPDRSADSMS